MRRRWVAFRCLFVACLFGAVLCCAQEQTATSSRIKQCHDEALSGLFDQYRPPERELDLSVDDHFSLCLVGDCTITRPLSQLDDPRFQEVLRMLRDADVTFGNLETNILDIRTFDGAVWTEHDDFCLIGEPAVGEDLNERHQDKLVSMAESGHPSTDADLNAMLNATFFHGNTGDNPVFESVLVQCTFARGRVVDIRLFPIDLGYGKRLTRSGIPRTASADKGHHILEQLRDSCQRLGTPLRIEAGVGSIELDRVRDQGLDEEGKNRG